MPKVETSTAFEETSELVLLRKLGIPDRRREALPITRDYMMPRGAQPAIGASGL